jgi:hypothetical protein
VLPFLSQATKYHDLMHDHEKVLLLARGALVSLRRYQWWVGMIWMFPGLIDGYELLRPRPGQVLQHGCFWRFPGLVDEVEFPGSGPGQPLKVICRYLPQPWLS